MAPALLLLPSLLLEHTGEPLCAALVRCKDGDVADLHVRRPRGGVQNIVCSREEEGKCQEGWVRRQRGKRSDGSSVSRGSPGTGFSKHHP